MFSDSGLGSYLQQHLSALEKSQEILAQAVAKERDELHQRLEAVTKERDELLSNKESVNG